MQALDKLLCRVQIFTDRETRIENIEKTSFVIGKSPEADVYIADEEIIRTDIGVNVLDGNIFITVLESPKGSWLGSKQLTPKLKTRYSGEPLTLGPNKVSITLSLTGSGSTPMSPSNLTLPPLPKYALEKLFPVTFGPILAVNDAKPDLKAVEVTAPAREQTQKVSDNPPAEATDLIVQAKKESEKILLEAKKERDEIRSKAESNAKDILARASELARDEADKALTEAHKTTLELKARWEFEQEHQIKAAQAKTNDLMTQTKKDSEKILVDAKKESEKILLGAKDQARLEIENAKNAARFEGNQIIAKAQATADRCLQAAESDSANLRLNVQNENEEQRKVLQAESLREAQKAADEIVTRAQAESNRTLDSAKAEKLASEQLRKETEKTAQTLSRQAEFQKQEILVKAEAEASGAKTKSEKLKAEALSIKAEIEKLKKEASNVQEEAVRSLRTADTDKIRIMKEIGRLKAENTILEEKKAELGNNLEKSNTDFLAVEKENQEKINNLHRTVESTESLLKQKTTEINSQTKELQKKIEEKLKVEKDLKILQGEKEKISRAIANQSALSPRQMRSKSVTIALCLTLGLAAIFVAFLYQGNERIGGFQQVPVTTPHGSRPPARVAVKTAPPPVALVEAPPARVQVQIQAKPQVPPQAQAPQPAPPSISPPISTSAPSLPVSKATTVPIKKLKPVSAVKNEQPLKPKPKPILPKANPDERQRDLDALQFSE